MATKITAKQIALVLGMTAVLVLCMINPYLPGDYDHLAVSLSVLVQALGILGIPIAFIGLLWLLIPRYSFTFAVLALVIGIFILLMLALLATLSIGITLGIFTIVLSAYIVYKIIPKLRLLKTAAGEKFNVIPFYLTTLPVLTLAFQLILQSPLTTYSRNRAVSNASEFLNQIEEYHAQHGNYPVSLNALHKDYSTDVRGIEKYHYAPQGNGYNLSFEQPRFLLDRFGTREWVVYNPHNQQKAFSHSVWLLLAEQNEPLQGWYESGPTEHLNWKYFLFD